MAASRLQRNRGESGDQRVVPLAPDAVALFENKRITSVNRVEAPAIPPITGRRNEGEGHPETTRSGGSGSCWRKASDAVGSSLPGVAGLHFEDVGAGEADCSERCVDFRVYPSGSKSVTRWRSFTLPGLGSEGR